MSLRDFDVQAGREGYSVDGVGIIDTDPGPYLTMMTIIGSNNVCIIDLGLGLYEAMTATYAI